MKENVIVEQTDLIGDIANFPIEVVQKMVDEQVKQGNKANVSVFQNNRNTNFMSGGFTWHRTDDGALFWEGVIRFYCFDAFFDKYPKTNPLSHLVYIIQDGSIDGDELLNTLVEYGGENNDDLEGDSEDTLYYIDPITRNIEVDFDCFYLESLKKLGYTEIKMKPDVIELTMDEIANKLGIDVSRLRIRK